MLDAHVPKTKIAEWRFSSARNPAHRRPTPAFSQARGKCNDKTPSFEIPFSNWQEKFWDSNFSSSFRCNLSRDTSSLYRKNTYRPVDNVLFYRPIFSDWTGTLPHPTVRRNPGAALGGPVSGNLDLENFRLFFPGAPIGPSPGFSVTTHRPRDSSRFSGIGTYDSDAPPESAQLPPQSSSIHRRDLENFPLFSSPGLTTRMPRPSLPKSRLMRRQSTVGTWKFFQLFFSTTSSLYRFLPIVLTVTVRFSSFPKRLPALRPMPRRDQPSMCPTVHSQKPVLEFFFFSNRKFFIKPNLLKSRLQCYDAPSSGLVQIFWFWDLRLGCPARECPTPA